MEDQASQRLNKALPFLRPYSDKEDNSYLFRHRTTVYTATKQAFAGQGGMKFFDLRFMAVWVIPMAIMGSIMEFLFVGPLRGTNPFG